MRADNGRPSTAVENYLKTVWVLGERGDDPIGTSDVAERLGVAAASVSAMMRKLVDLGHVEHARYGAITLTAQGRRIALAVVRRHRLIEQLLVTEFDYGWDEVHDEAEALEHVVSDRLVEAIAQRLGDPVLDPHGDPIPGRDGELAASAASAARRLSDLPEGTEGDLVRVDDDAEVLRHLTENDLGLGDRIGFVRREPFGGPFVVRVGRRELRFGPDLVDALWIRA